MHADSSQAGGPAQPQPSNAPLAPTSRRGAAVLLLAVFLGGSGTMVVELAAVRLLAPWFGSSNAVWTHAIGVILLALAVGYALGARWSLRAQPRRAMVTVLLGAALWCAALPSLTPIVADWFMPAGLTLHSAAGLLLWGSLASSLVLFTVPALLLGCVAPMAVEALAGQRCAETRFDAGQAGGYVLALSTGGSLVGTFATTYWLVPTLGLQWTFGLASSLLALAALLVAPGAWRVRAGAALALIAGASFWSGEPSRGLPSGWKRLAQEQSAYQWLQVLETGEGPERRRRLVANEALDSFQSLWRPEPGWLGQGSYYDAFAAPLFWDEPRPTWRLAVLGLGAGSAVRVLEGVLPQGTTLRSVGLEIDPEVVRLGELFFDLENNADDRIVGAGIDARAGLGALEGDFDQIIVDAYANNVEIPPHLCTVEFFREIHSRLRPGGWLSVNLSGFGLQDPVIRAVAASVGQAWQQPVLLWPLPFSRNTVVLARRELPIPDPRDPAFVVGPRELQTLLASARLRARLQAPGVDAELVLTDDHAPILALERRSVARGVAGWLQQEHEEAAR